MEPVAPPASERLPPEGGVEAAFKAQIEAAPDPEAARREIRERIDRLQGVVTTFLDKALRGVPIATREFSWDFLANFEKARGEVLAILNSDDVYHRERIEECVGELESGLCDDGARRSVDFFIAPEITGIVIGQLRIF